MKPAIAPNTVSQLVGLTVSLRLRLLLAALIAILLSAGTLFALHWQQQQSEGVIHRRVSSTLDAMQAAEQARAALTELRRAVVQLALTPAAQSSEAATQLAIAARIESVQASAKALEPIDPAAALRVRDSASLLGAAGIEGMAQLRSGQADLAEARFKQFPQLGAPAEAALDLLFSRQQQALREIVRQSEAGHQQAEQWARGLHLLIVLLGLTAAMMVLNAVFRPLHKLYLALGHLAQGHALPASPVTGHDEFGQLGTALYELSQLTAELNNTAYRDSLSGLPNRAQFERDVADQLLLGRPFALMFADIDHFRTINDGYGHPFGDQVLKSVAERLQWLICSDTRIYRYSGDLFAICVQSGSAFPAAQFHGVIGAEAERLRSRMAESLMVETRSLPLCLSFGVALYPDDGSSTDALLSAADAAMYQAKQSGRNAVQFARADYALKARRRLELADELRNALKTGALAPYFQPIVDLGTGAIVCAEALARWKHPVRGYVPPDEFIVIAEESGQIDTLTEQLLLQACASAVLWQPLRGHDAPRLAFNLSARQVRQGVVELISKALAETGLPARRLEIEITESAIIERPETAERLLRELRELGVSVALDDFGTGYSSLSYLMRFPIDKIKVDRSFVAQLNGQRQAGKIVAATIALAANLEITLVAEGVETVGQMVTLYELGCRQQQGWLFSKALPADLFNRWAMEAPLRLDAVVRAQADSANDTLPAAA